MRARCLIQYYYTRRYRKWAKHKPKKSLKVHTVFFSSILFTQQVKVLPLQEKNKQKTIQCLTKKGSLDYAKQFFHLNDQQFHCA
jgi:hypothetical protein